MNLSAPLLGPRRAVWLALSGISLYTVLVGADAAVVMTLINPHALWDLGFQLSFAATLSLMLYADPFTDRVRAWLRRRLHRRLVERLLGLLSEAIIITLAAQVLTLPLMLAAFDQLSLVSLPAKALILPAQPAVMT